MLGLSDYCLEDLIARAAQAGAYSVSTEALCVELRSVTREGLGKKNFSRLSEVVGFDLVDYYRKHSHGGGYLRLTPEEKSPIFNRIHNLCDRYGLKFFCSDACGKGESFTGCCCGAPPEFGYSRGNFSAALQIAKQKGLVRFSGIAVDMGHLSCVNFGRAKGYNTNTGSNRAKFSQFSLKDYLRYLWNTTERGQSPAKMFADFIEPAGLDESGDIVYRRKK